MHFGCTQCKQKGFVVALVLVGIAVFVLVAGGAYYLGAGKSFPVPIKNSPKVCIQDAKQCPDGSYVGREGPNCEFKACPSSKPSPTSDATANPDLIGANWKILHLVNLSFSIPQPWSYKEEKDSLVQKTWINLYPPQASKDQKNITEKDTDVSFVINYLPNTTVLVEEQKVRTNRVIENITEEMAAASVVPSTTGKGIVTGKSFYGTYTGSGSNRPKDIKITYFQYGEGVYSFEFTDATHTFGKYYNQILSTFKFLDQSPTACGVCPKYGPPSTDFYKTCQDKKGKIVTGEKDQCGCQLPPRCQQS